MFVVLFLISFAFSRDEHALRAVKWIQGKVRSVFELVTVFLFKKKKTKHKKLKVTNTHLIPWQIFPLNYFSVTVLFIKSIHKCEKVIFGKNIHRDDQQQTFGMNEHMNNHHLSHANSFLFLLLLFIKIHFVNLCLLKCYNSKYLSPFQFGFNIKVNVCVYICYYCWYYCCYLLL